MASSDFDQCYRSSGIFTIVNEKKQPQSSLSPIMGLMNHPMPKGADPDWWTTLANSCQLREKLLSFASSCQTRLPGVLEKVNLEPSSSYFTSLNGSKSHIESGASVMKEEYGIGQDTNPAHLNNNLRMSEFHNGFVL